MQNTTHSLYWQYVKERTDGGMEEYPWGFFTYVLYDNEFFIEDVYVTPEARLEGYGRTIYGLMEECAKKYDKQYITGSVWIKAKNYKEMISTFLTKYSFEIVKLENDMIYIAKKIGVNHGK